MGWLSDTLYPRVPTWAQTVGINAFGIIWRRRRYGGPFLDAINAFQRRERFGEAQWQSYQASALRAILLHAYNNVEYYHDSLSRAGLSRADCEHFELKDLPKLPFLEKQGLREAPQRFIASTARVRNLHRYNTSGTTGTPLTIYVSNDTQRVWSAAYEARCRRWAGVDYTMSRAMIGGRMVVPRSQSGPPFWRYNAVEKHLYMSAFHICPANVPAYLKALAAYNPSYLVGYASSHFFLARFVKELGLSAIRPKAVLTSSEKLTEEMRSVIEGVYRCRVFDAYSGVEACCLASECEAHNLHVSPDVGIVEVIAGDGSSSNEGEIVATGFLNYDQPLIRYRTGDIATLEKAACACGRCMPRLSELVGRIEDTIYGLDGRETVRFHGVFVGLPGVREGQIVQESLCELRVRVVTDGHLDDKLVQAIRRRLEERLGSVQVHVERVDRIERTGRGKFKGVIGKVARRPGAW